MRTSASRCSVYASDHSLHYLPPPTSQRRRRIPQLQVHCIQSSLFQFGVVHWLRTLVPSISPLPGDCVCYLPLLYASVSVLFALRSVTVPRMAPGDSPVQVLLLLRRAPSLSNIILVLELLELLVSHTRLASGSEKSPILPDTCGLFSPPTYLFFVAWRMSLLRRHPRLDLVLF